MYRRMKSNEEPKRAAVHVQRGRTRFSTPSACRPQHPMTMLPDVPSRNLNLTFSSSMSCERNDSAKSMGNSCGDQTRAKPARGLSYTVLKGKSQILENPEAYNLSAISLLDATSSVERAEFGESRLAASNPVSSCGEKPARPSRAIEKAKTIRRSKLKPGGKHGRRHSSASDNTGNDTSTERVVSKGERKSVSEPKPLPASPCLQRRKNLIVKSVVQKDPLAKHPGELNQKPLSALMHGSARDGLFSASAGTLPQSESRSTNNVNPSFSQNEYIGANRKLSNTHQRTFLYTSSISDTDTGTVKLNNLATTEKRPIAAFSVIDGSASSKHLQRLAILQNVIASTPVMISPKAAERLSASDFDRLLVLTTKKAVTIKRSQKSLDEVESLKTTAPKEEATSENIASGSGTAAMSPKSKWAKGPEPASSSSHRGRFSSKSSNAKIQNWRPTPHRETKAVQSRVYSFSKEKVQDVDRGRTNTKYVLDGASNSGLSKDKATGESRRRQSPSAAKSKPEGDKKYPTGADKKQVFRGGNVYTRTKGARGKIQEREDHARKLEGAVKVNQLKSDYSTTSVRTYTVIRRVPADEARRQESAKTGTNRTKVGAKTENSVANLDACKQGGITDKGRVDAMNEKVLVGESMTPGGETRQDDSQPKPCASSSSILKSKIPLATWRLPSSSSLKTISSQFDPRPRTGSNSQRCMEDSSPSGSTLVRGSYNSLCSPYPRKSTSYREYGSASSVYVTKDQEFVSMHSVYQNGRGTIHEDVIQEAPQEASIIRKKTWVMSDDY